MRVNRDLERVFVKDRHDLARMVGHLLGCHAGHSFFVNADSLSLDVDVPMLTCLAESDVGYVFHLENMMTIKRHHPIPPF